MKTPIRKQNVNKVSSPGSSQCWKSRDPGNEVNIAADVNMIAVSRYPSAGHGFQNTRYLAVWNSYLILPKFLIDFFKDHKAFVYKPQAIPKIALALK